MSDWQFLILNMALALIAVILIIIAFRLYDILNKFKFVPENVDRIRTDVRHIREDMHVGSLMLSDIDKNTSPKEPKKSCETCNYEGSHERYPSPCKGCIRWFDNFEDRWEAKE